VQSAEAHVHQAEADVHQAREQSKALQAAVGGEEARVRQARAGVQEASGGVGALQGAVAQQVAKIAQARTAVAEARDKAAADRADVAQESAKIGQAQATLEGTAAGGEQVDVQRAEAQAALSKVSQARARVDELLLQVSYTRILAQHDGVISRKSVSVGQTVQNGQTLMVITDLTSSYVTANFKETQLGGMRAGDAVELEVDAYPGHTFHGHVASFSAGTGAVFSLLPPENASGNFTKVVQRVPVKIDIDEKDDGDYPLRLGLSASVSVEVGDHAHQARSAGSAARDARS
jgi:membrane fusion protein (multidrug efflux system)